MLALAASPRILLWVFRTIQVRVELVSLLEGFHSARLLLSFVAQLPWFSDSHAGRARPSIVLLCNEQADKSSVLVFRNPSMLTPCAPRSCTVRVIGCRLYLVGLIPPIHDFGSDLT